MGAAFFEPITAAALVPIANKLIDQDTHRLVYVFPVLPGGFFFFLSSNSTSRVEGMGVLEEVTEPREAVKPPLNSGQTEATEVPHTKESSHCGLTGGRAERKDTGATTPGHDACQWAVL